ncbi:WD repeat-containing protein 48 [Geosmithia morbida]|uniref:WD repeat-containing protein 48 n=1 Tax=Geosmithia morbida TaxID=1094350 RepID=A0A9P5D0I3_9HYPO|nr:WD repeat-containing protein 48 [Geosmithia morbida]KAF4121637.1 WD repeat-containing protein 48 [Geosmithia morbida]
MASRKARQRISYVLEDNRTSAGGHRLGVLGIAVDTDNDILYSGGRDGTICAWDLRHGTNGSETDKSQSPGSTTTTTKTTKTTFRAQTQAHTHWINDIVLAQNNTALVSASSDLTVKVWRPHSEEGGQAEARPIGTHADYANRVAAPPADMGLNWVASGGLDRKVCLWDLSGAGKTLEIDVTGEDQPEKGSVYALAVGRSVLAVGSPEKTVRLYDHRSGSRVSKLVGHVDNIRSILIDDAGETILSASADKTIKMWSVRGGRCVYTFTMHDEPVWSLHSTDPRLAVFYSTDRSGLVAKTDIRRSLSASSSSPYGDMDDGLSLAIAKEHSSVWNVAAAGGSIWTATGQSSINRWDDTDPEEVKPIYQLPAETVEGLFGLLKHKLLNDRRRVLTLDTAGEVVMWDLIKCRRIESFGKQHLEDVEAVVNTREAVAPWCSIDLSSGNLTVVLEQYNCFDAEVYADELELDEPVEFREDQRISLGRWILRYLFANLIDEELKRDEDYRRTLNQGIERRRANAPASISLPQADDVSADPNAERATTPKANGMHLSLATPGLAVNQATPLAGSSHSGATSVAAGATPISPLEKRTSHTSRPSGENSSDYFASTTIGPVDASPKQPAPLGTSTTTGDASDKSSNDKAAGSGGGGGGGKSPVTPFGKKFRMSFGTKKLGRSGSQATQDRPAVVDEKADESESSSNHDKDSSSNGRGERDRPAGEVEDNLYGVIQKLRNDYDRQLSESPDRPVETGLTPSLPSETPVLKLPPSTKIFIQEDTSGSAANIYEGTVGSAGDDADVIEQRAPKWLGHVLLQNQVAFKDTNKISFVLHPWGDLLPPVSTAATAASSTSASDGASNRLNANRMLRVKKILAYVCERIEVQDDDDDDGDKMHPEEYLELYCNEELLDPYMSLATLRTHVWKGGNDIILYYKANGRKEMKLLSQVSESTAAAGTSSSENGASSESAEVSGEVAATNGTTANIGQAV